jgi:uncharacterized protein
MFGLSNVTLDQMKQSLQKFPEIEEAWMFGSRAMGNQKKGSDIDIAIKGQDVSDHTVSRLHRILEQELPAPYFFDVLDYNKISNLDLKKHIDQHGKKFYSRVL